MTIIFLVTSKGVKFLDDSIKNDNLFTIKSN